MDYHKKRDLIFNLTSIDDKKYIIDDQIFPTIIWQPEQLSLVWNLMRNEGNS